MLKCATTRCRELEKKVIRLSVAMDDKAKSIELLHKVIDDIDMNFIQESSEIDVKFQHVYKEKTRCHDEELAKLEIQCRQTVENKKIIASELEQLHLRNDAKSKLSACLDAVGIRTEESIVKSKQEFEEGAKKREQEFLSNKAVKVRKATLAALQPELKRLLDSQRMEIEQLKQEEETKLNHSKLEATGNYEARILEYRKESESQKKHLVSRRKTKWMEQISSTQETYAAKFNNIYHERGDWNNQLAVKELEKEKAVIGMKHEVRIDKILESRDLKLKEIENIFKQQEKELDSEFKEDMKNLEINDSTRKNTWRKEQKDELQMNLENQLAEFRKDIEKKRDDTIDIEIRSSQKKESHFEREFGKKIARGNNDLEEVYKEKMHCVEEESASKKKQLKLKSIAIQDLENNIQAYKDQFEMTERSTENVTNEFITLKQHNAVEGEDTHAAIEAQANVRNFAVQLRTAQDELEVLQYKIENFDR